MFFTQSIKQLWFPKIQEISFKSSIKMLNFNFFIRFYPDPFKGVRGNWRQSVLISTDLVTARQGQGHWKSYRIVDVNSADKHDSYKRIWLEILPFTSSINILFFAANTDVLTYNGRRDKRDYFVRAIVTSIDQGGKKKTREKTTRKLQAKCLYCRGVRLVKFVD